jgi:hypothetical protein
MAAEIGGILNLRPCSVELQHEGVTALQGACDQTGFVAAQL